MPGLGGFDEIGARCRPDRVRCARGLCNPVPILAAEIRSSSARSLVPARQLATLWVDLPISAMDELRTTELAALRKSLTPLVSNLDETLKGLPEAERTSYDEAEQSVVDARRKAETHEGLLQVS